MKIDVRKTKVKKMVETEVEERKFVLELTEEQARALRHVWGKSAGLPKELLFLQELDEYFPDGRVSDAGWFVRFVRR